MPFLYLINLRNRQKSLNEHCFLCTHKERANTFSTNVVQSNWRKLMIKFSVSLISKVFATYGTFMNLLEKYNIQLVEASCYSASDSIFSTLMESCLVYCGDCAFTVEKQSPHNNNKTLYLIWYLYIIYILYLRMINTIFLIPEWHLWRFLISLSMIRS